MKHRPAPVLPAQARLHPCFWLTTPHRFTLLQDITCDGKLALASAVDRVQITGCVLPSATPIMRELAQIYTVLDPGLAITFVEDTLQSSVHVDAALADQYQACARRGRGRGGQFGCTAFMGQL